MNDPAYRISKYLVNEQNEYLNLDHQITTKNSINLEEILTKLKWNSKFRTSIYDIKNLYVNIPTKEILSFTKSLLPKQNDAQTTKQIITLLDVILQQNYFSFKPLIYQTETGISMVSPISSTITEHTYETAVWYEQHSTLHQTRAWHTVNIQLTSRNYWDSTQLHKSNTHKFPIQSHTRQQ